MDILRDRCPLLLKRASSFCSTPVEAAGLSRGGSPSTAGLGHTSCAALARKRPRTSEPSEEEDSETTESFWEDSGSEETRSSSSGDSCADEKPPASPEPPVPGIGVSRRLPGSQTTGPRPPLAVRCLRLPGPAEEAFQAVLCAGPGASFYALLGSRAVYGFAEAATRPELHGSQPKAKSPFMEGADPISSDELFDALRQRPIIVAAGRRGTDILRWLRRAGPENLSWEVEVHDTGLLRNVLHGSSPEAIQACACTVASLKETLRAAMKLARQLRETSGELAYTLLLRSQSAVAAMEAAGVPFDHVGLQKLCLQWRSDLDRTEADVRKQLLDICGASALPASNPAGLNLRSNSQVAGLLARQLSAKERSKWPCTPGGALRTDSESLRRSGLPWAEDVVRFRELSHALSHYERYIALAKCGGGRLFPSYQLAGAVTGRMTCANPNLQSSPRLEEFRSLFRAGLRPGWDWLVQGDFSQIELRVLAELAADEQMRAIFRAGEDLHRTTAALLSGVAPEEVSTEQRQFAKAVNFGLVYGQSAEGLQRSAESSYGMELSYAEAYRARQGFLAAYPAVAEWQQRQRESVLRGAEVKTAGGRVAWHLVKQWKELQGGLQSDPSSAGRLQREAINFPVQGTAAEVMLACLESLRPFLQRASESTRLVCVVHDEFLLESTDTAAAEQAARALREAMEDAWCRLFPGAVLGESGISVRWGWSWSELK
ncbi:polA [Symbiodinium sp. CCMP2592]|nr:polA [Symbiodinium sp. CCMP2592]